MSGAGVADYIRARQSEVEAALATVLPQAPQCPEVLARAMRYSVMAGGKRVRPILCLASADAVGGRTEDALPAACAIELIHTYSLIHDDLPAMDDDTLRRGQPTLHVVAGEGMAILAGDGLLTEAFSLMARAPDSSDPTVVARKLQTIRTISTAAGAFGMVGGQAVDLHTAGKAGSARIQLDAHALREMHAMKTGALITAAAAAGAIMGGGTDYRSRPSPRRPPSSAWHSRSSTTSSTWRAPPLRSARRLARMRRPASRPTPRSTGSTGRGRWRRRA